MKGNIRFQKLSVFIAILVLTTLSCKSVAGFNPFATPTPTYPNSNIHAQSHTKLYTYTNHYPYTGTNWCTNRNSIRWFNAVH